MHLQKLLAGIISVFFSFRLDEHLSIVRSLKRLWWFFSFSSYQNIYFLCCMTFSERTCDAGATWKCAIFDDVDERIIPSIKWNYICNIKYDCKFSLWRMKLMCTSHQIEWVNKEIIMMRPWCLWDGLDFTQILLLLDFISTWIICCVNADSFSY